MRRKIYEQLLAWKHEAQGNCALLIEGARRIGKSYIVTEFGKNEYESYLLIDFNSAPENVKKYFDDYLSNLDMLFQMLSLHYNVRLIPRKSLIIFDEVQMCPRARAAIKYLVADGRFDYIETGSLISIRKNVKNIVIPSEERSISMYPMDFEEFLWALGNDMLMPYVRECYEQHKPVGAIHQKVMELFRLYMVIGGMPQVVQTYVNTKDFRDVESVKQNILHLYRDDIRKYAIGAELKAGAIFESIPSQLQLHSSHFCLADLDKKARFVYYESAFFWLQDSKIANICYNTFAPNIGLGMNTDRTTLKCYLGDTGLFVSMAFCENGRVPALIYEKLLHGKLETNLGVVVENIVAQMLQCAGHRLFFYQRTDAKDAENTMEIDFLISKTNITSRKNIRPIEVKSGNRYTTTSLQKCLNKYRQYVTDPLILHTSDFKYQDGITYLPLYMTMLL